MLYTINFIIRNTCIKKQNCRQPKSAIDPVHEAQSQPQSPKPLQLYSSSFKHLFFNIVYIASSSEFLPGLSSPSPWWLVISMQCILPIPYCGSILLDNRLSVQIVGSPQHLLENLNLLFSQLTPLIDFCIRGAMLWVCPKLFF